MKHLLSALVALTLFISCSDTEEPKPPVDYRAQNEKEITDYIAKNDLNAQKSDSGLYYVINEQGDGVQPTATSNVTVSYKAYFINGTVLEETPAEGITLNLNRTILGWTEGIPHFNVGSSGTLLIPAHLAYGSYNYGSIPAGSVIIFDIKLISVNEPTTTSKQSKSALPIKQ